MRIEKLLLFITETNMFVNNLQKNTILILIYTYNKGNALPVMFIKTFNFQLMARFIVKIHYIWRQKKT
jgi:hypothetical protein